MKSDQNFLFDEDCLGFHDNVNCASDWLYQNNMPDKTENEIEKVCCVWNRNSSQDIYDSSEKSDTAVLNSYLPSKFSDTINENKRKSHTLHLGGVLIINSTHKIVAAKVVIACHLFGTLHSFVSYGIQWLADNLILESSQNMEVGDAKKAIAWLIYQNIDVEKIVESTCINRNS